MSPSNSKTSRLGLACLVAIALPLFGGPIARADSHRKVVDPCLSDAVCSGLYEEARRLSKSGDLQAALVVYQTAYRRQAVPWLLINIGRTLQKLGRQQEALAHYQRYVAAEPAGPADRQQMIHEYTAQAEKAIADKAATPPATPEPAPADKPLVDNSTAAPSSTPSATPPPPAVETPPPAKPEPPPTAPALAPPIVASAAPILETPPVMVAKREPGLPRYFWAGIGVGGGLLAVGIVTGGVALSQSRSLQETPYAGTAPDALISKQGQVRALAATTDALLAASVVTLGVVTVVALVQHFRHRDTHASVAALRMGPGGFFGRF